VFFRFAKFDDVSSIAGMIFSMVSYSACKNCSLIAHHECAVGLPETCRPVVARSGTRSGAKGGRPVVNSHGRIDDIVTFPSTVARFFVDGMFREDCWLCRRRLAKLRASFPDGANILSCERCITILREQFAIVDKSTYIDDGDGRANNNNNNDDDDDNAAPRSKTAGNGGSLNVRPTKKLAQKKSASSSSSATTTNAGAAPPKPPKSSKQKLPATTESESKPQRQQQQQQQAQRQTAAQSTTNVTQPTSQPQRQKQQQQQQQQQPPQQKQQSLAVAKPVDEADVSVEALQYCEAGNKLFETDLHAGSDFFLFCFVLFFFYKIFLFLFLKHVD
jgi:hypothetical protein